MILFNFVLFYFMLVEAFDPLDPTGNVTIRWDIMSWTSDGYMVSNFQTFKTVNLLNESQLLRGVNLHNYT